MTLDFAYQQIYTIFSSGIQQAHAGQKRSSLVDISNLNKTKGLSGNQVLNKNSSNDKKQKTTSVQSRTKNIFLETFGQRVT